MNRFQSTLTAALLTALSVTAGAAGMSDKTPMMEEKGAMTQQPMMGDRPVDDGMSSTGMAREPMQDRKMMDKMPMDDTMEKGRM